MIVDIDLGELILSIFVLFSIALGAMLIIGFLTLFIIGWIDYGNPLYALNSLIKDALQ